MPTFICRTEADEAHTLDIFRNSVHHLRSTCLMATDTKLVTFNGLSFDLPVLITRYRLLGLTPLTCDVRKYGSKDVIDLMADLTFNDNAGAAILSRSQASLARRFGIPTPDPTSGKDVAAMVAAGDYDAVAAHCQADLDVLRELYRRVYGAKAKGVLLDLETVAIANLADYRADIKGDKRLTDPKKVEADIDAKLEKAALDPYLCRIACLGFEILA